jgi:ribosomal protein S18 acetylase RimI-like enzyme
MIDKMKLDDGREVIFRYPEKSDLRKMWKFYNKVINETEFLARITPVSLRDERKWFDAMLSKVKKKDQVYIIAECDGDMIGSTDINRKFEEVHKHVGAFGIAVLREYHGKKIGTRLMQLVEKEAKKMKIEILQLSVYGTNSVAQGLYRKMGFVEAGRVPLTIRHRSRQDDEIIMYKVIR